MPSELALLQLRDLMTSLAVLTGLITSLVTLAGSWFMLKFQIRRHDEQIAEIKKTLTNGHGLVQQIQSLNDRVSRIETVCRERHSHRGEE